MTTPLSKMKKQVQSPEPKLSFYTHRYSEWIRENVIPEIGPIYHESVAVAKELRRRGVPDKVTTYLTKLDAGKFTYAIEDAKWRMNARLLMGRYSDYATSRGCADEVRMLMDEFSINSERKIPRR